MVVESYPKAALQRVLATEAAACIRAFAEVGAFEDPAVSAAFEDAGLPCPA